MVAGVVSVWVVHLNSENLPGISSTRWRCRKERKISQWMEPVSSARNSGREAARITLAAIPSLLLIVVVRGGIIAGWFTPKETAPFEHGLGRRRNPSAAIAIAEHFEPIPVLASPSESRDQGHEVGAGRTPMVSTRLTYWCLVGVPTGRGGLNLLKKIAARLRRLMNRTQHRQCGADVGPTEAKNGGMDGTRTRDLLRDRQTL